MKICKKCKMMLPLRKFIKNKHCKDGYGGTCKICQNAYNRKWKQKNESRLAPIRRKQYAERYGAIVKENSRQRKLKQPLRCRAQVLRGGMLSRSKKLGLKIDKELFTTKYIMEWLSNSPYCECCGRKLNIGFKMDGKPHDLSPSMDRKIPSNGYTKANTALLCWRCNNLKRNASADELRKIVQWMDTYGDDPRIHTKS